MVEMFDKFRGILDIHQVPLAHQVGALGCLGKVGFLHLKTLMFVTFGPDFGPIFLLAILGLRWVMRPIINSVAFMIELLVFYFLIVALVLAFLGGLICS